MTHRASDPNSGWELWKSDGTASGTVLINDIQHGELSSTPRNLTNVNGTLYFTLGMLEILYQSNGVTVTQAAVIDQYQDTPSGRRGFDPQDQAAGVNGGRIDNPRVLQRG